MTSRFTELHWLQVQQGYNELSEQEQEEMKMGIQLMLGTYQNEVEVYNLFMTKLVDWKGESVHSL